MKIRIKKGVAKGTLKAPPSKSFAHRLLICSLLADGKSEIEGVSLSKDVEATLNCISSLGATYTKTGEHVSINGGIKRNIGKRELYCNESGSTLRFILPLALLTGEECVFYGSERLFFRGIGVYEDIFKSQGVFFEKGKNYIRVKGEMKGGIFNVPGDVSSQFISGLLFALPLLKKDSQINLTSKLESSSYVDITIDALKSFGIEIIKSENSFFVKGNQSYIPQNSSVEGDFSNAAFLDAFNILGGDVSVLGLNWDSLQGDKVYKRCFEELKEDSVTIDISDCPDLGPILFALASVLKGATFVGTKRLKIKESDRCAAMKMELEKFGSLVEVNENSVVVKGGAKKPYCTLNGHNDHRIVMALSVILTLFGGEIDGCEAISKSYPNFFEDIEHLGISFDVEE